MENEIKEMCQIHFNEPIICNDKVVRLIGYGETAVDCYLICSSMDQGIFWQTAVGGYMFLDKLKGQGYIRSISGDDWNDFTRLDSLLSLNGAPRVKDFLVDLRLEDDEIISLRYNSV